jgi:hypothetical protein
MYKIKRGVMCRTENKTGNIDILKWGLYNKFKPMKPVSKNETRGNFIGPPLPPQKSLAADTVEL